VGIDIGTQSAAIVAGKNLLLVDLAKETEDLSKTLRRVERAMDRSRRATNPGNYRPDGTVKKRRKTCSNRYQKLKSHRKELYRKQRAKRRLSHRKRANQLLSFGDVFYTETMRFQALQKRAKQTKRNEATGKYRSRKRFGKSIGHRAPSLFKLQLEEKIKQYGGTFHEVDTHSFKASQYDHTTETCQKKPLSQRWHTFANGAKVQRICILPSSSLTANKIEKKPTKKCQQTFHHFLIQHHDLIEHMKMNGIKVKNAGF
jgi:hypothetical protein